MITSDFSQQLFSEAELCCLIALYPPEGLKWAPYKYSPIVLSTPRFRLDLTLSEAATSGSSNRQRFSHPIALVKDVDWKSKVSVRPLADFAIRNKKMKL